MELFYNGNHKKGDIMTSENFRSDFIRVEMGDHEFARFLRSKDHNWTYVSHVTTPSTYYYCNGDVAAVVFYDNRKSTHEIFIRRGAR